MSWEYEALFDVEERDGILADYWRTIPTAIKVGSMGYRTRTIKAGQRLEAEVYPIWGRQQEKQARERKQNITPERQQQLNTRRAKRRLILLLETNFRTDRDIHVTLTYAGDPPEEKRCRKDLRNFLGRVKRLREKRGLEELKYIYAIGRDGESRIHVHCVMNGGIQRDELEKIWGKGFANTYRLQEYGKGLQGMANYLYRQNEKERDRGDRPGLHAWSGSRNLKKPKVHTSDSKLSNRQVRKIAKDFESEARSILEKIYRGYTLEEGGVWYSDVVDGAYIRVIMRRRE